MRRPSHAAIGTVQDDLDAIRKGTLSGTAAVTQVQTDAAAVLTSMGLTSAQVSQIQADQQALAAAIAADPNQPVDDVEQLDEPEYAPVGFSVPRGIAGHLELRHGRRAIAFGGFGLRRGLRPRRWPARRVHGAGVSASVEDGLGGSPAGVPRATSCRITTLLRVDYNGFRRQPGHLMHHRRSPHERRASTGSGLSRSSPCS